MPCLFGGIQFFIIVEMLELLNTTTGVYRTPIGRSLSEIRYRLAVAFTVGFWVLKKFGVSGTSFTSKRRQRPFRLGCPRINSFMNLSGRI